MNPDAEKMWQTGDKTKESKGWRQSIENEIFSICWSQMLCFPMKRETFVIHLPSLYKGLPGGASGKESPCQGRRCGFNLWVGKIPWRRAWQPTLVFLPRESHGQGTLAGYSPWSHKE